MGLEQEVKLAFPDVESARRVIRAAGAVLVHPRRLLDDQLFDTPDRTLARSGTALRIRRDGTSARLTWKGRVQASAVKTREELETTAGDAETLESILEALGYRSIFRQHKYREEYELGAAVTTIDETPAGVFVEIEAAPEEIDRIARHLGRTPDDFLLDSYPTLWRRWCAAHGMSDRDMLF